MTYSFDQLNQRIDEVQTQLDNTSDAQTRRRLWAELDDLDRRFGDLLIHVSKNNRRAIEQIDQSVDRMTAIIEELEADR